MSAIHPPLPMSNRDSQRLLSLLNSSFSKALDKEHPKVSSDGRNSTDQHVRAMLSSPIFTPDATPNPGRSQQFQDRGNNSGSTSTSMNSISLAHVAMRQNVDTFRKQIATGSADLATATASLRRSADIVKTVTVAHGVKAAEAFKIYEIGMLMLDWLWSSGLGSPHAASLDLEFIRSLVPFIFLEGQLQQIIQWFQRMNVEARILSDVPAASPQGFRSKIRIVHDSQAKLYSHLLDWCATGASHSDTEFTRHRDTFKLWIFRPQVNIRNTQRILLYQMVWHTMYSGSGANLNDGIRVFVQVSKSLETTNESFLERSCVLQAAGNLIVNGIENRTSKSLDPATYNSFCQTVYLWSSRIRMAWALLEIHHPTSPNSKSGYSYMKCLTPQVVGKMKLRQRRSCLRLGLHTAEKLLSDQSQHSTNQAEEVMSILRKFFKSEIGALETITRTEQSGQNIEHPSSVPAAFALAV